MKKLLLLLLIALTANAYAQNCTTDFLGTKTLYTKPAKNKHTAPAGYQPVFVNYVGRHGARHLTKDVNTYYAYKLLMQADSLNALTAEGAKLKKAVVNLNKVEKGNTKSISDEGRAELRGIGERLYTDNSSVFKGSLHFNVAITKEVRTKQSADAFLAGLKSKLRDSVMIDEVTDDVNLRFYDLSPVYKAFEEKGEWTPLYDQLEQSVRVNKIDDDFCT